MDINEKDINKFCKFLNLKEEFELRCFKPKWDLSSSGNQSSWFVKNGDEMIDVCKKLNGEREIYVGINERSIGGKKDEDIKFITNIGHDIDAHDGTPESFMKAQEVALKMKESFIKKGFEEPLILCSGWGFWVINHIEPIENTEENITKIKQFGVNLKKDFEVEGIELDSTVYNPSRIARVPGTLNCRVEDDKRKAFIINDSEGIEDHNLTGQILNIKIDKPVLQTLTTSEKPSINNFMNYCITTPIPSGERHKIISRHIAIYIFDKPNRDLLKETYIKTQSGKKDELDNWLKDIEKKGLDAYPFMIGQLVDFTKKYKIPFDWKQVQEYKKYIKEKAAERNLKREIEREKITSRKEKDNKE